MAKAKGAKGQSFYSFSKDGARATKQGGVGEGVITVIRSAETLEAEKVYAIGLRIEGATAETLGGRVDEGGGGGGGALRRFIASARHSRMRGPSTSSLAPSRLHTPARPHTPSHPLTSRP